MKYLLSVIAILVLGPVSLAQNEMDALRYSQTFLGGTARSGAMSGAFGALGADFSTLSSNPAGIAVYRSSEFVFTPQLYVFNNEATYNGSKRSDFDENFNFSNIGLILTREMPNRLDKPGWRFMQFGVGINRLANYNGRYILEGVNNENTITDVYADLANGINFLDIENDVNGDYAFGLNPAWWSYAIDTLPGMENQYRSMTSESGGYLQRKSIQTWGSMNEIVFSFGANYNDRFFIGATMGFPSIRYFYSGDFREEKLNEDIKDDEYRYFEVSDALETKGTGFNFKLGMIFIPVKWFRIGGAVHTPTYFTGMTDEWYVNMHTHYDTYISGDQDYYGDSPYGIFDYDLRTPFKALGNLAFLFGRYGLISADYEYIDYSSAKLRSVDYDFSYENQNISDKYTATHNVRVGTEWRYANFSYRGGFALYQSPFANNINDGKRIFYSLGAGYKGNGFFLDIAWIHEASKEDYYLYGTDNIRVNPTLFDTSKDRFMVTLGFKFQ